MPMCYRLRLIAQSVGVLILLYLLVVNYSSGALVKQLTPLQARLLILLNGEDVPVCAAGSACLSTQRGWALHRRELKKMGRKERAKRRHQLSLVEYRKVLQTFCRNQGENRCHGHLMIAGVYPQVQLPPQLLDLWETEIVPQLPEKLEEQARVLKAYQRHQEIERASDLLRAILSWVLGGCSFRQLGCWAVLLGVADIRGARPGGNACDCAEIG